MSSAVVTLDEIRNYVNENGPVEIKLSAFSYYMVRAGQALLRYPKEKRSTQSRFNLATRIDELLPNKGTMLLSSSDTKVIVLDTKVIVLDTKVIVLDEKTKTYREAALDISENRVIPTETLFSIEGFKPTGQLMTLQRIHDVSVGFYPASQTAFLVKQILELNAPVVEIGVPFDGYYPAKLYSR